MLRGLFILSTLFSACLLLNTPALGKTNTNEALYSTLVTVDEVADNAMNAKERALSQAEIKGLLTIMQNISPDTAQEAFDTLSAKDIHNMVQTIRVENEREKATRYQADVYLTYNKTRVDKTLAIKKGIVEETGLDATGVDTVLVLPVLDDGNGNLLLWHANNTWRNQLNDLVIELGKNKVIMPFGDPTDTLWMDQQTVLSGDLKVLQKVAERYGTRNVVIATAKLSRPMPKNDKILYTMTINLRRAGEAASHKETTYESEESAPALMQQAATATIQQLANTASQFSIFQADDSTRTKAMVIRAEYTSAKKWIDARQYIETIDGIKLVEIGAVTPYYAQATLYYSGSEDTIKNAIINFGMTIKKTSSYLTINIP